jgi:hypothetical protein
MRTTDALRIGDAERDAAIAALSRHFADGRLTQAEHEERMALALRARTGADLRVLFADLPRLEEPAQVARPRSGGLTFHWVVQPLISGLMVAAGVLLVLHLVPIVFLVAMTFLAVRLAFGGRKGWSARSDRSSWPRTGGGYYGR